MINYWDKWRDGILINIIWAQIAPVRSAEIARRGKVSQNSISSADNDIISLD